MAWEAIVAGALSAGAQGAGAVANYLGQKKANEYNKSMQEKAWEREDTAVQRRKADLIAAGLSPVLAAGSAATTMAPIRTEAPQIDTAAIASAGKSVTDSMMQSLAMKQGMENITKTQAETAAIDAQRDKSEVETAFMRENNPLTIEGTKNFLAIQNATKSSQINRYLQETKGIGIDNANKAADNSLKKLAISNAEVDLIKNKISVNAARMGLTDQMLDIVSKRVAIDLRKNEVENAVFDTDFYHSRGLPRNFSFGTLQPIAGIGAMTRKMMDDQRKAREYKDYYKYLKSKGGR